MRYPTLMQILLLPLLWLPFKLPEYVVGIKPIKIEGLDCANSNLKGVLVAGQGVLRGTRVAVPYFNGKGKKHDEYVIYSTGVFGLQAILHRGTLRKGPDSLILEIQGTPVTVGMASFALSFVPESCTLSLNVLPPIGTIGSLNCSTVEHLGALVSGRPAYGVSSRLAYEGGNGGTHNGEVVQSSGGEVKGLTAWLQGGTFENGSGNLVYSIKGTPIGSGTATFALNIGGHTCTIQRRVNPPSVTSTIVMKNIPAGTFPMGCTSGDEECYGDEHPVRSVTLNAFQIGETEVTQAQYQAIMGSNPSYYEGTSCPVEQVSWFDAVVFCNRLSEGQGLRPCYYSDAEYTQVYGKSGGSWVQPNAGMVYWDPSAKGYRLPTEAEWEYAARGGVNNYLYSGSSKVDNTAWFANISREQTQPVKSKQANGYGLYDMSGNVMEWCQDWYGEYDETAQNNPTGTVTGTDRVLRGGSWYSNARSCRVSYRSFYYPSNRDFTFGFRVARQL